MVRSHDWYLLLSVTGTQPSGPAHSPWKRGRHASSSVLNNAVFSYVLFLLGAVPVLSVSVPWHGSLGRSGVKQKAK